MALHKWVSPKGKILGLYVEDEYATFVDFENYRLLDMSPNRVTMDGLQPEWMSYEQILLEWFAIPDEAETLSEIEDYLADVPTTSDVTDFNFEEFSEWLRKKVEALLGE